MEDGLVDLAYRDNRTERELLSRGYYPYEEGNILDLSGLSDPQKRDYSDSDPERAINSVEKKSKARLNPNAPYYSRFLSEVEEFDIPLLRLSREAMESILARYFPRKFGSSLGSKPSEVVRGIFMHLVGYSREQRELLGCH